MSDCELKRARNRVEKFMNGIEVKGFIEKDIEKLLQAEVDKKEGTGGLAVPLGLTCFSIMDYFGYLTRTEDNIPDDEINKRHTAPNITQFVDQYFPKTPSPPPPELLILLYRHGLMHQFFPKACAISRGTGHAIIELGEKEMPCLYVDALARAVLSGLENIRIGLSGLNGDELVKRINRRLDLVTKEDREELAGLKRLTVSYLGGSTR